MIPVVYSNLCPVCGEDLESNEIEKHKCFKKGENLWLRPEDYLVREF